MRGRRVVYDAGLWFIKINFYGCRRHLSSIDKTRSKPFFRCSLAKRETFSCSWQLKARKRVIKRREGHKTHVESRLESFSPLEGVKIDSTSSSARFSPRNDKSETICQQHKIANWTHRRPNIVSSLSISGLALNPHSSCYTIIERDHLMAEYSAR